MRFVQISYGEGSLALVNSQHISHISVRTVQAPDLAEGETKSDEHDYPIYRITMFDGAYYELEFSHNFPDDNKPFDVLMYYYPAFRTLMQ